MCKRKAVVKRSYVLRTMDEGWLLSSFRYSRVPNKRGGGVRITEGGLNKDRYNNNRGVWNNRGGGAAWRNRIFVFLGKQVSYVNSDVTDTYIFELWFC